MKEIIPNIFIHNDKKKVLGRVGIRIKEYDGSNLIDEFWVPRKNLVVRQGRIEECHIIAGDDIANRVATYLAVGDQGNVAGDPFTPVPPTADDTALNHEVFRKQISSHSYPVDTTVEFYTIITQSEANGYNLTEAGLFCLNNSLFARITFEVIPKTAARTIEFFWRIIY